MRTNTAAILRDDPLKVVSIAHTAVQDGIGRLRYKPLTADGLIDFTLIVPSKWKEYGRELTADSPSPPLDIRTCHITLADVPKAKWYLHFYPRLSKVLDELSPDVLHLWEEPWSAVALQAALLCQWRYPNTALILETDQNILRELPPPFEQIRRYTLRHTDTLIVRQDEALTVSRASGYQGPSVLVEYCVDRDRFHPSGRNEARQKLGTDSFTLGYVGRLAEEKGLFTVIDAVGRCKQDVKLFLLGDGPDRDRLIQHVKRLSLEARVQFLPPASQENVARFMNALDAFVLMSCTTKTWKEQFGRVIIEAQACGVPVIGSNSGSIPSVVGDGGWIIPEADTNGLTALVDRLATTPAEVSAAAAAGLQHVRARFSQEAVAAGLRRAYFEAIRSRREEVVSYSTVRSDT